jgi:hypothetical protein
MFRSEWITSRERRGSKNYPQFFTKPVNDRFPKKHKTKVNKRKLRGKFDVNRSVPVQKVES